MKIIPAVSSCAVLTLVAGSAFGQLDLDASAEASADTDADMEAEAEEPEPEPAYEPEPEPEPADDAEAPEADDGESDHEKVVGTFGVGYLGRQTINYGFGGDSGSAIAPIIGVRYWINDLIGIDGGIGLSMTGGTIRATDADDQDLAGHQAFLVHAGVPLSLAHARHFSFQVVPEANIGFAGTGDQNADPDIEVKSSGFLMNVGAKVGAEIQFGFMDIPNLSLQGGVGLYFQHESVKTKTDADGADETEISQSGNTLGTTLDSDPWDIFTSSVSALYYF